HVLEHVGRDAAALLDETEQDVLGAQVLVVEPLRLLAGEVHHLLRAVREAVEHGGWIPGVPSLSTEARSLATASGDGGWLLDLAFRPSRAVGFTTAPARGSTPGWRRPFEPAPRAIAAARRRGGSGGSRRAQRLDLVPQPGGALVSLRA